MTDATTKHKPCLFVGFPVEPEDRTCTHWRIMQAVVDKDRGVRGVNEMLVHMRTCPGCKAEYERFKQPGYNPAEAAVADFRKRIEDRK